LCFLAAVEIIQSLQQYDDEISLLELWLILREDWIVLASTTVTGIVIAIITFLVMTPIYRAEAIVAEVESGGARESVASTFLSQFGGLSNLVGFDLRGRGGNRNDGRTIIQSRTFIEQFIEEQELMPVIYADLWDKTSQDWDISIKTPPAVWRGANKFIRDFFYLEEDNETGLLTVTIEWSDPILAAHWANRLVEMANEKARQRDITDAESSIAYLNEQIEQTNAVELQRVLYNLVEVEQQTLMLANAREDYVFQIIDPAMVPVEVAKPNLFFLLVLGVISGGFLGIVIVFTWRIAKGLQEQESARDSES
jgi:uncharacterized protein involved in exopolysaccharide biosynthesis